MTFWCRELRKTHPKKKKSSKSKHFAPLGAYIIDYIRVLVPDGAYLTRSYGFYGRFLWVNTRTVGALSGTLDGTACDGMYPS